MERSNRYEYAMVAMGFCCWGLTMFDRLAISFLMPIIQAEWAITNTQVGQIGLVTSACYAISAIIFGRIADRSGLKKKWLLIFVFGTFLFSSLGAVAQNFVQLLFVRALVGVFEGPVIPLLLSMTILASRPENTGRNTGILNTGNYVIAATIGPALVTQVVAHYSWQTTFLLVSLPTLVIFLFLAKFSQEVRMEPQETSEALKKSTSGYIEVLKIRNVAICAMLAILQIGGYWLLAFYAPLYLVNISKLSVQSMGWVCSLMGIAAMISSILMPKLSDNYGRKPLIVLSFAIAAITPLFFFLFQGSTISIATYILFGGFVGCMSPVILAVIPSESEVPMQLKLTATALIMGLGDFIGGAVWPLAGGSIADAKGIPFMMLVGAVLMVVATLVGLGLKETHSRKMRKVQEI